jgi:hypothetical protein
MSGHCIGMLVTRGHLLQTRPVFGCRRQQQATTQRTGTRKIAQRGERWA